MAGRKATSGRRRGPGGEAPPPGATGAVDIAMEAERTDESADNPARRLLLAQLGLVADQRRQVRVQTFSEQLGAGLKVLLILGGVLLALALGVMVWNAAHDRSLVISAIATPPDMAARGLTGQVVANQLMDKLAAIDAKAQSFRAPATFHNDWSGDIQIEIPQTGVSIGQIDRYLRQWIGRQSHIGGELWRGPDRLNLTVRAGGGVAASASGQEPDLDRMLQQAAEGVFRETQPFRYSKYLEAVGRTDEAMAVARDLAAHGPAPERPWAWAQVSNLLLYRGDFQGAAAAARTAVLLDPKLGLGWLNLGVAEGALSHVSEQMAAVRRSVQLLDAGDSQLSDIGIAMGYSNRGSDLDGAEDHAQALYVTERSDAVRYQDSDVLLPTTVAWERLMLHDIAGARSVKARLPDAVAARNAAFWGSLTLADLAEAQALDDWPAALADLDSALMANPGPQFATTRERQLLPPKAEALARLGRIAEARAIAGGLPPDCDRCILARAEVAALAGDPKAADRWFGEAGRRAPSMPRAFQRWGLALLARGDLDAAAARFARAHEFGPRWADPLEGWGEALLAHKDYSGAVAKFDAAAPLAPKWGRLQLRWGQALFMLGDRDKARAHFLAASQLVMSAADQARLKVYLRAVKAAA